MYQNYHFQVTHTRIITLGGLNAHQNYHSQALSRQKEMLAQAEFVSSFVKGGGVWSFLLFGGRDSLFLMRGCALFFPMRRGQGCFED
jgi:hypothetical protein